MVPGRVCQAQLLQIWNGDIGMWGQLQWWKQMRKQKPVAWQKVGEEVWKKTTWSLFFFCVCGFCGGELNTYQVHPSTISTFFVNPIYESFQSLQTRLTNLPTKGDLWSFCESPEESHHTPANTSCFSWRVTSLTRLACRIIPGPCHTRFFPSIGPRWRGDHELSAMTLWIVYVGTSIWVDLGKKANLTDIWHAVRERKPRRITIEKDKEDRGTKERPAFVCIFVHI